MLSRGSERILWKHSPRSLHVLVIILSFNIQLSPWFDASMARIFFTQPCNFPSCKPFNNLQMVGSHNFLLKDVPWVKTKVIPSRSESWTVYSSTESCRCASGSWIVVGFRGKNAGTTWVLWVQFEVKDLEAMFTFVASDSWGWKWRL